MDSRSTKGGHFLCKKTDYNHEFVDKCTARWKFEKTGVELYDHAIKKAPDGFKAKLQEIRNQEKQHEEMLEDVIRRYGADPHAETVSSRITTIESEGIVKVVRDENFSAVIDALLAAELVDNANWQLLIELADNLQDDEAKGLFQKALDEEETHLRFINEQVLNSALIGLEKSAAA